MSEKKSNKGPRGGFGQMPGAVEKPKDFKGNLAKLLNYLKPYMIPLILVIILASASSIFAIMGPKILKDGINIINEGYVNRYKDPNSAINFTALLKIIYTLVVVYCISSLFTFLQGFIVSNVAQKISYKLRREISLKINLLPLSYFDKKSYGDVMSRVTNDVDTISQSLNQSLSQIVTSVTTVIGVLIMMLSIDFFMTLVALLIVPLSSIVVMIIVKSSQIYFRKQQELLGTVNGQIEEMFTGYMIVKAFNNEENAKNRFNIENDMLYNTAWKSQFLSSIIMPIINIIGNFGYIGISILGGYLGAQGKISIGDISAFLLYIRSFNQPIAQIAQISNLLQSTIAASERVFEFLEEPEEVDTPTINEIKLDTIKGNVQFDNVSFSYNKDKPVINNFSANIKQGQKIAIVGETGAGKTTIVKLLMRFYDVNSGAIKVDGFDIKDFSRYDLRNMFSMVLQDTWLFNGTIMENIRYGNLNASDEDVINAAKAANIHRFIKTLKGGYNMVLNDDVSNISQGQRQLITIARAILAKANILILDEATSSVDTRTEVLIQNAMENLSSGKTSFIIAHRLSTIKNADLIVVMSNGDIVEQGNHNELINNKGVYFNLYNSQFTQE